MILLLTPAILLYLLGAAMCYGYETMDPARETDLWVIWGWPAFVLTACFASLLVYWIPSPDEGFDPRNLR